MTRSGVFRILIAVSVLASLGGQGCGYPGAGGDPSGVGPTAEWWSNTVSRVETSQFPKRPDGWLGPADLYGYVDPEDPGHFANIFRWPRAHTTLAVFLSAISVGGSYGGDEIGIFDLSNTDKIEGMRLKIDGSDADRMIGFKPGWGFNVVVIPRGNDTFIKIVDFAGNAVSISINALYRWRVYNAKEDRNIGDKHYKAFTQGGLRNSFVYFRDNITGLVLDPSATRAELTPPYVVQLIAESEVREGTQLPIGDTGYVLRWEKDNWYYRLAR